MPNALLQKTTFPRVSLWLLGLMFTLPILGYHHYLPIPSFYNEWFAAALGLAALGLFLRGQYWKKMGLPVVALVPLGMIIVILIQIPTDRIVYSERSILGASYLLWAALLMMLARTLVRELGLPEVVRVLAWFLLLGGILNTGIAFFQHFRVETFFDPYLVRGRVAFANIGQVNHFSDYIALALGSLLFLFSKRCLHWGTALLAGAMLLYALSLSGSRSSWLYVLAMAALSLAYLVANGKKEGIRLALAGLMLVPVFFLMQHLATQLTLTQFFSSGNIVTPTDKLFDLAGSKSDRLAIWQEAWQIFLRAPLLGTGFGEFVWQHFLLSEQAPVIIRGALFNHAHNIVMQVLAEMGIFAALLLVAGVFAWALRLARAGTFSPEKWWLLALISVLAIHSMLEYPLWYAYFLGIAAVLMGIGETRAIRLQMQRVGQKLFVVLMTLGCISLFNLVRDYRSFEGAFRDFGIYLNKQSDVALLEDKAQEFVDLVMKVHRESLLSSYSEIAVNHSLELNKDNLANKLLLNGRVLHVAPINDFAYRQVIFHALNGDQQAAERMFDLSAAAYPKYVPSIITYLKFRVKREPEEFLPLLQHAEKWLEAHPENAAGKPTAAASGTSGVASGTGKP